MAALLHDGDGEDWRIWFRTADLEGFGEVRHHYFSDYSLALSAARRGQGVTLGMSTFVEPELRRGSLSQLGRTRIPFGDYWLLQAHDRPTAKVRSIFSNWLQSELATALTAHNLGGGDEMA